jgi:hypothetical protein
MEQKSIFIPELFHKIQTNWWVISLFTFTFTFLSILLSYLVIKPIYTAEAVISLQINFKEVGHLTQFEQDQYIGVIRSFFLSDEIINSVVSQLQVSGEIAPKEFLDDCFLEREINELIFRCQNNSPEIAAIRASNWSRTSYSGLEEAYQHAENYHRLLIKNAQYETCITQQMISPPAFFDCSVWGNPVSGFESQIETERKLSKGVFPGIMFSYSSDAAIPKNPVRYGRNALIISGLLLGLITSILYLSTADRQHG